MVGLSFLSTRVSYVISDPADNGGATFMVLSPTVYSPIITEQMNICFTPSLLGTE